MKKLLYLSLATSFFAAQIFTINLSVFQLSLFRATVFAAPFLLLLYALHPSFKLNILPKGENRFSIKFMLLWLFYSIISLFWVKNYYLGIRSIYFIASGVMLTVLFSMFFTTKRNFQICFNIMQMMVVLHNIIGWYEIVTRDYRFISTENIDYYVHTLKGIPISMLGNPNDFALLMLFGTFISYICFKINKTMMARNFSLLVLISSIILVFATQSRANIIGLFIAVAMFGLLKKINKRILIVLSITLIVITLFIFSPEIFQNVVSDLNDILKFNFKSQYMNSEIRRLNLIKNGLYFLKATYGFGTGAGNIEYWMEHRAIFPVGRVTNIHNWWIEILSGYGILIFIVYLLFYVKLFKNMYITYKKTDDLFESSISLGVMCCMAGFTIASVSSSSNISKEWLWAFWAVAVAFQGYTSRYKPKRIFKIKL